MSTKQVVMGVGLPPTFEHAHARMLLQIRQIGMTKYMQSVTLLPSLRPHEHSAAALSLGNKRYGLSSWNTGRTCLWPVLHCHPASVPLPNHTYSIVVSLVYICMRLVVLQFRLHSRQGGIDSMHSMRQADRMPYTPSHPS